MAFFATLILIVVFLAILILGHELGHFLTARLLKVRVEEFGFGYPPRLFSKNVRGVDYSFNLLPFGGFVKIPSLESGARSKDDGSFDFEFQPVWKKALILFSGIALNFLIGWLAFSVIFSVGIPKAIYIHAVLPGSPAAAAGLKNNDRILNFQNISDLNSFLKKSAGNEIELGVNRDGKTLKIKAVPREPSPEKGALGVELFETGVPKENFLESVVKGFTTSCQTLGRIAKSLSSMVGNRDFSEITGPLGIWNAIGIAQNLGWLYLFQLLGLVSLNLVFINILPIPALDGGRLLFLLIEKIKGRPVNYRLETVIHSIFLVILLFLMLLVTIKDITKLLL
jgi:regulator of sigma E protease